jgi:hypothetical protein
MSRRRKPEPDGRILIKVGCTGRGSHKRLIFDTVSVDADDTRFIVGHNQVSKGEPQEANVPRQDDHQSRLERILIAPPVEFHNHRYQCPLCGLDFPMDAATAGEKFFGPAAVAGVSFLDLSVLRAIL